MHLRAALAVCLVIAACTAAPRAPEPAAPRSGEEGDVELLRLADEALARGEVDTAADRYERTLAADPHSRGARVGLGRVALARGEPEAARGHFDAVLAAEPEAVDALLGLAEVERAQGHPEAARELLDRCVALAPERSDAHAQLAALTGAAPDTPPRSLDEILGRVDAHPYDPRSLLAAAVALARVGETQAAVAYLERVAWLGDVDPSATESALRLLTRLDAGWRARRIVPVYSWADEPVRAREGWRFQLRTLWLATSNSLDPVLGVRFVSAGIGAFRSEGAGTRLEEIHAAAWAQHPSPPAGGLLAAFTGRELPRRPGHEKMGLAEFAGRRASVRIAHGDVQSRVLAHEVLHLYGGVHLAPEIESIMNPTGESWKLDAYNLRIVRALRGRAFEAGGVGHNVLPRIDLEQTGRAFSDALAVNLTIRRMGLAEAARSAELSRFQAAAEAGRATELDPHLADVLRLLATIKLADHRSAEAVALLETASRLYGPATPQGRESRTQADALRQRLEHLYGD